MDPEYRPSSLPENLPSLPVPGYDDGEIPFGQRAAEWVTKRVGSWPFIIGQSVLLVGWAIWNCLPWTPHWDPYPFILMNLFMSLQAAYTAPMIMMAQNRESGKDRYLNKSSYVVSAKTDVDVQALQMLVLEQSARISQLLEMVERLPKERGQR